MNRLGTKEINERITKVHGDVVCIVSGTYLGSTEKATFFDVKFGEWKALLHNVLSGQGHPSRGLFKRAQSKKLSLEEILSKMKSIHGENLILDTSTYSGTKEKARFIDKEFGEFWTKPNHVLQGHSHRSRGHENRKETCVSKYGVEYPMQNSAVSLKQAKSQNNICLKIHWKTGEELICLASYEAKTVDYLNNNEIDFEWQSKTFSMPNGKTYRPDLYLIKEGVWVEIKGYFRKGAKEKWDWFQSTVPNSELWNKEILKEMGIL